jgi:methyl-accepting chemotaxis protein
MREGDIWWEIYYRFFYKMKFKRKMAIGYLVLALPPLIMGMVFSAIFTSGMVRGFLLAMNVTYVAVILFFSRIFTMNLISQISQISDATKEIVSTGQSTVLEEVIVKDEIGEIAENISNTVKKVADTLQETRDIVEGIPEPIFVIDTTHKIVMCNSRFAELMNKPKNMILGREPYEVFGLKKKVTTIVDKVIETGVPIYNKEITFSDNRGRRYALASAIPLRDSEGNIVRALEIYTDITALKNKEREIKETKEYLESEVDRLLPVVAAVAEGDLTQGITTDKSDPLAMVILTFNEMRESLQKLIARVRDATSKVAATADQLAATGEEMNATTQEISSSVQQIAQGAQEQVQQMNVASREMKKIAEMADNIRKTTQAAAKLAEESNFKAKKGGEAAKLAIKMMRETIEVVDESTFAVKSLEERSRKIVEIVDLITNIAEQTNLLALNAAIEAARAGEHGRGFAVVAEEVRKLAEESAKSAEKIGVLIRNIQHDTEIAVSVMSKSSQEVNKTSEIINEALGAFESIVRDVEELTSRVSEISAAMEEQSMASEKVVKAIDDIAATAEEAAAGTEECSAATEEQTANMEELSATAQELANLAVELKRIVDKFKIEDTSKLEKTTKIEERSVADSEINIRNFNI